MSKKTEAEYQEWVKEVSAKVPDEQKANFDALIGSPFGTELFEGTLRTKEFHRRMNEVHDEKESLKAQREAFAQDVSSMDQWFQAESPKNQRLIAERDRLATEATTMRERLQELGLEEDTPSKVKQPRAHENEDIQKQIQALQQQIVAMDRALPQMLGDYGAVLNEARDRGYKVDPREVIALSLQKSVPLPQALEMLTFDQRKSIDEKERSEAISKAREEGRREALSQRGSPDYMKPAGPGLDAIIKSVPTTPQDRVAGAVAEWMEIAK